jgi:hypothetical protein
MVVGAFWVMQGKETGFSPTCLSEVSGSLQMKEKEQEEKEIIFEVDEDLEEIIGEEMVIVFTPVEEVKEFIVSEEDASIH